MLHRKRVHDKIITPTEGETEYKEIRTAVLQNLSVKLIPIDLLNKISRKATPTKGAKGKATPTHEADEVTSEDLDESSAPSGKKAVAAKAALKGKKPVATHDDEAVGAYNEDQVAEPAVDSYSEHAPIEAEDIPAPIGAKAPPKKGAPAPPKNTVPAPSKKAKKKAAKKGATAKP